ncbi:uncharacterized protein BX664DRAFT_387022 [Halteromyces radiatus]|uniref:uncharacterized protein n=1 Tax=Halteromyces radiatus TaxID=101107 RepID=UPI00221FE7CD|nr:uncharacterized protein BX664DRAFT_387022 [Halteromyces radiatus]KAI8086633.1 hypothetical protein BX664DRAFT_387022 [Halteromyces radiatus]
MFKAIVCFTLILLIHQTYAQTACAAEANFQGCKTIQETRLGTCGPADYSCQCTAHRLIQECYNLCPGYASQANIHAGTVESICAAVPSSSSSLSLPSASSSISLQSTPSNAAVASPSVSSPSTQHSAADCSFASNLSFTMVLVFGILFWIHSH